MLNWLFLEVLKYISILTTECLKPQMNRLILAIFFAAYVTVFELFFSFSAVK